MPGAGPAAAFLDANNSLGVPDVNTTNRLACYSAPSTTNCKFTSLGDAGVLVLRFTDNLLSGSSASGSVTGTGDGFNDLYLVEVGVSEATTLDISSDGNTWFNVGSIAGGAGGSIGVFTYGFDIDRLGFGTTDLFTYVRITDVVTGDPETSPQGADIDAVGAIQTAVPAPAGRMLQGYFARPSAFMAAWTCGRAPTRACSALSPGHWPMSMPAAGPQPRMVNR